MIERGGNRATLVAHRIVVPWAIAAALSLLIVTPAVAASTIRHVAMTGVDAGDCAAPSAPCRTITYALTQAVAGDTILVGPGEYLGQHLIYLDGITIEGADPSTTTVNGTPCPNLTTFAVYGSDVTLRGLGVGGCPEGVVAASGNAHVIVQGNLFLETTDIGVSLAGGSATVLGNVFRNSGAGVCDRAPGHAVVIGNTFVNHGTGICVNVSDATVRHNRITNQPDIGVHLGAAGKADLNDNWWGCNGGPNGPDCATLVPKATVVDRWLQLEPIGAPATLGPGDTVELSFGLVSSTSGEVATEFPSAPVAFSATAGSVEPDAAPLIDGVATTTFTAPNESGVYTVSAGLDRGTASVTLNAPIAPAPRPTESRSPVNDPTPPPTSTRAGEGEGDRGGSVPLPAIVFLFIAAWLIGMGLLRRTQGR